MMRQRRTVLTNFLIDQPVRCSIRRETTRAAKTIVRWASINSRLWWQTDLAHKSDFWFRSPSVTVLALQGGEEGVKEVGVLAVVRTTEELVDEVHGKAAQRVRGIHAVVFL